jgi:hypothetical protein
MVNSLLGRRAFLGGTLTTLVTIPAAVSADQQAPEAGVYGFELPPKSVLLQPLDISPFEWNQ